MLFELGVWAIFSGGEGGGGGQVGTRALGRRPWERNSTHFAVSLNVYLSRKLDQSMLKICVFWGKKL